MVPSLRVEHKDSGVRFFGVEPGFVLTEVMKANGLDDTMAERFKPTPQVIAEVMRWLAESDEALEWQKKAVISAPELHRKLLAAN